MINYQLGKIEKTEKSSTFLLEWQPQPLEQATTLPAEMYLDPAIYQLEKERIFGKTWYYVGHLNQLNGAGSYFTVDIAEQPLVILKNKAGELRAFFNICTHRGGPLATGSGNCNRLTCLYHAWSFDLDGNLRYAPDMESAHSFDSAAHSLTSVKVETWGPFIFVNLDPHAQPLATKLAELPEMFQRYQFTNLARVHTVDYNTEVNWKVFNEITVEGYHEPIVHQATLGHFQDCNGIVGEAKHYYYLQHSPLDFDYQLNSGFESGLYIDTLNQYEMEHFQIVCLFPNFTLIMSPNHCATFLIDPQGIKKTHVRLDLLVPDTEAAKSSKNLESLIQFYADLMQEDFDFVPTVQKRIQSLHYRPGRLSPKREMGVHLYQELVMKHILEKE
ncbi:hypothetical protein C7B76_01415 [filamentous cyanobacterium CCP2]|nr:hypothetical protein C7B76_01415 [filamentous cyanobacterium CCP2]